MIGSPSGVVWALEFKSSLELYRPSFLCSGGTLLGITRDQALIEWDDDLDFLVPRAWLLSDDFFRFRDAQLRNGHKVSTKGYPLFPSASFFGKEYKATLSSFLLTPSRNLRPIYSVPRTMLSPKDFLQPDWVAAHGANWPVPMKKTEILTHIYGEWETPSRWDEASFYNRSYLNRPIERRVLNAFNMALGFTSKRNAVWDAN